ncbi:MAG: Trm112 family protein [Devosia sp.]|nr:Trm112 family protein [Devosia sp.]
MAGPEDPRHVLDRRMLEMLVCPLTKTRLTLSPSREELVSVAGRLAFPIVRGVPLLSLEEARNVDPDEIKAISAGGGPAST